MDGMSDLVGARAFDYHRLGRPWTVVSSGLEARRAAVNGIDGEVRIGTDAGSNLLAVEEHRCFIFSPSPMTTMPRIDTEGGCAGVAAAPSPPSLSSRPTQRPAVSAPASVTRTSSFAQGCGPGVSVVGLPRMSSSRTGFLNGGDPAAADLGSDVLQSSAVRTGSREVSPSAKSATATTSVKSVSTCAVEIVATYDCDDRVGAARSATTAGSLPCSV